MMIDYFVDLHIHIGRAKGLPVKITGARNLTFKNIIEESTLRKGLEIIGIVDCASPLVLEEIEYQMANRELYEHSDGGLIYKNNTTIILGSEIETVEENGKRAHSICYFPYLEQIKQFSKEMKRHIKNINLSSQSCHMNVKELYSIVADIGGILIPAHVFTPHKSFYGSVSNRLGKVFTEKIYPQIIAIELGLSADSDFASRIYELRNKAFLSNSDAHSLPKIGREYNILTLKSPTFKEVVLALKSEDGRRVKANYGLDPRLGKYHRTRCLKCNYMAKELPPILKCPICNSRDIVTGVLDRITVIQDSELGLNERTERYYYQIPLEFIPKVGPKTINLLLENFGTEMNILHKTTKKELELVVGSKIANNIIAARNGKFNIAPGGGGIYGKLKLI